jgi:hypothetical protein
VEPAEPQAKRLLDLPRRGARRWELPSNALKWSRPDLGSSVFGRRGSSPGLRTAEVVAGQGRCMKPMPLVLIELDALAIGAQIVTSGSKLCASD